MKIYFVRHGESEANILRQISNRGWVHGLTEKGRQQAAALAQTLAECGADRIYASPLRRAVETAQILSTGLGVPYQVTDALREFDCGIAEGGADEKSWGLWRWVVDEWFVYGRPESKIDGGESLLDLRARLGSFLAEMISSTAHAGRSVICIGHGGLFISALPDLLANLNLRERVNGLNFPNTGYVLAETRPGGLFCLEWCGIPL